jgi:autotransporter family porin
VERGKTYSSGDAWGCMGAWYSGRWYTAAANTYIDKVKNYLKTRVWETPGFQEK